MSEDNGQNFTPEQQAQLEAAKLARIEAELKLTAKQEELASAQRQEREARQKRIIRDTAASTARFHNLEIVEKLARADYDLAFDDNTGEATGLVNGQRKPLADVFKAIALGNEHLCDGRSLRHLKDAEERKKAEAEVCKSEMSVEQKIAFIDQHGLEKFEALPLRRPRIVEVKTFADYLGLPLKSRMAYVEKYGPDAAAKLPRN